MEIYTNWTHIANKIYLRFAEQSCTLLGTGVSRKMYDMLYSFSRVYFIGAVAFGILLKAFIKNVSVLIVCSIIIPGIFYVAVMYVGHRCRKKKIRKLIPFCVNQEIKYSFDRVQVSIDTDNEKVKWKWDEVQGYVRHENVIFLFRDTCTSYSQFMNNILPIDMTNFSELQKKNINILINDEIKNNGEFKSMMVRYEEWALFFFFGVIWFVGMCIMG